MFENIPDELKAYPQWVMWRYEEVQAGKLTKRPYCLRTGRLADVTDASNYVSFEDAIRGHAMGWYDGIGFALTDEDPYAFVDLDDTDGNPDLIERQIKIFNEFESYAEKSPSGNGLHIIVKGKLPSGRKRAAIEIYSSARFMTMTGDIFRNAPILDYQEPLGSLWARMETKPATYNGTLGYDNEVLTDDQVLSAAMSAKNGEKFKALFAGHWQSEYPSQSEADFALINIVAFYSKNRKQVARIFSQSELGKRDKAKRADYVGYMLNRCFDRMLPPVDVEGLRNRIIELIEASSNQKIIQPVPSYDFDGFELTKLSRPIGLVGEVMDYLYAQAPRPNVEIALSASLALFAGIAARAYNVSNTGLNMYILSIAATGVGKESGRGGAVFLMQKIAKIVPSVIDFVGPAKISSEQAIIRHMSEGRPSFVSFFGEYGMELQQMSGPKAAPMLIGIRKFMLDVYNKSGEGQVFQSSIYSDSAKNTAPIYSPAFSFLGDSTKTKFYEALSEDLITDGLLPRFCVIESYEKRPPANKNHANAKPNSELIRRMAELCSHSLDLNKQNKTVCVQLDYNAETLMDAFDRFCDYKINSKEEDVSQSLWTRAHVKALKLAAMIAVGCNPYYPQIDEIMTRWAINLVINDVKNLLSRFDAGEIGINDDEGSQILKLVEVIRDFLTLPWSKVLPYIGENGAAFHHAQVIPYAYLQRRLASVSVFRKDRSGATNALHRALKVLIDRGDIQEIDNIKMFNTYNVRSRAFAAASSALFRLKAGM